MQIVIDIAQNEYDALEKLDAKYLLHIIKDGTPLPKGHGRLIDADAVTKDFQAFYDSFVINTARGGHFSIACNAPTILKADKEVDE